MRREKAQSRRDNSYSVEGNISTHVISLEVDYWLRVSLLRARDEPRERRRVNDGGFSVVGVVGDQLPPSSITAVAARYTSRWSMPCQEGTWALMLAKSTTQGSLKCRGTFDGDGVQR